jgi:hypothetical protein
MTRDDAFRSDRFSWKPGDVEREDAHGRLQDVGNSGAEFREGEGPKEPDLTDAERAEVERGLREDPPGTEGSPS